MKIEEKNGYTIIDRRGGEPCRVCCSSECHTQNYGEPTIQCVEHFRREISSLKIAIGLAIGKLDPDMGRDEIVDLREHLIGLKLDQR